MKSIMDSDNRLLVFSPAGSAAKTLRLIAIDLLRFPTQMHLLVFKSVICLEYYKRLAVSCLLKRDCSNACCD